MQRYFVKENITDQEFFLPPEIFHHAIDVMRDKVGDRFEIIGPDRQVQVVKLLSIDHSHAKGQIIQTIVHDPELPVQTTIVCGISKGDKTEKIVQKGTELGADRFIFYNSERSVAQWNDKKAAKKLVRLKKISQGAAEQSHRTVIPEVLFCQNITAVFKETWQADYQVVAYEESAKQGETSQLARILQVVRKESKKQQNGETLALSAFFGPEGGFSPKEIKFFKQQNVSAVGLGPRIMRAETAPLYLLAALSFVLELE